MKIIMMFIFISMITGVTAQSNPLLADTLASMVIADQKAAGLPPQGVLITSPNWLSFKDSLFTSHYQRLSKIFEREGYPGYDKVGKSGAKNFWLMVQHLDKWPDFQLTVLKAMEKEVNNENASPADFAYLTDRVRLNTGQKQVYGTQVKYNTDSCQAYPKQLDQPETVNLRRKQAGLTSLEIYLNQLSESHFIMNKDFYEKKGITKAKLYPVKEQVN